MKLSRAEKIAIKKKFDYYKSNWQKEKTIERSDWWFGHMVGLRSAVLLLDKEFVDEKLRIYKLKT